MLAEPHALLIAIVGVKHGKCDLNKNSNQKN